MDNKKILAVADNEAQKARIGEIISVEIEFTTAQDANEQLRTGLYDLVIAKPENIFIGGSGQSAANLKNDCASAIYEVFTLRSGTLKDQFKSVRDRLSAVYSDALDIENAIKEICALTFEMIFNDNDWLELYISQSSLINDQQQLDSLYRDYTALFPKCSDQAYEVVYYILNNPESDLKQKTIAQKLYINSSYLSTVFAAQTGVRYVDYLAEVKLRRAAYLIMNTDLGIGEIAERLGYKDMGYFSRLFKARYGMPPSQYRLPYNYTYEI